jgi:hypothetical protein
MAWTSTSLPASGERTNLDGHTLEASVERAEACLPIGRNPHRGSPGDGPNANAYEPGKTVNRTIAPLPDTGLFF